MPQAKALDLNLKQGVNRLFDFVLNLARAAEAQGVLIRQEYSDPGSIP